MAEEIKAEVPSEEEKNKSSLTTWIEEHPKAVFWIRFALWTLLSCVLPFSFIVWRFELFRTIAKIQIGGWGLIAILILAIFVFTVIRYVKIALSAKHSLLAQTLSGFCKIIVPLLAALFILNSVKENVELMIQVLGCVTICEAIAIPLNPLPKWAYDMQKDLKEEERKETVDYLIDSFFKRKKEEKSGD